MPTQNSSNLTAEYVGRFAPSPTGPLHFGSLIAAVASYVDAKANRGLWLLRMEDLDPPREPPGAAEKILLQLQQLQLEWDGEVLYQSQRLSAYEEVLESLSSRQLCFPCSCTRQQIKALGSIYDGRCRKRNKPPQEAFAIRLKTDPVETEFDDLVQGLFQQNIGRDVGDFVVRRKDNFFAYQLAVAVDDAFQGINTIIRGFDLLDSTSRQIYLQSILGYPTPRYGHVPIIVNEQGEKLSKQRFAPPVDTKNASQLIHLALQFLGQSPPDGLRKACAAEQLQWAIEHWRIQAVPKLANIPQDSLR